MSDFVIDWLLAIVYCLLAIGYCLLAIGYWLLAIGYWLLYITEESYLVLISVNGMLTVPYGTILKI